MLKYQCNKCEIQKELSKVVMKVIEGKVVNVGTECPKCGEYMQEIFKFGGFPNIKRTEPTLSNKNDKLWNRAKDTMS
jgi:uncharacterized Zn finger protein